MDAVAVWWDRRRLVTGLKRQGREREKYRHRQTDRRREREKYRDRRIDRQGAGDGGGGGGGGGGGVGGRLWGGR